MKFHLVYPPPSGNGQSPVRVVEQTTGREVGWINRFLDREYVRRLGDKTLRTYAHHLLHFVRWWDSIHTPAMSSKATLPNRRSWIFGAHEKLPTSAQIELPTLKTGLPRGTKWSAPTSSRRRRPSLVFAAVSLG